jgi:Cu+-exporting ATPase
MKSFLIRCSRYGMFAFFVLLLVGFLGCTTGDEGETETAAEETATPAETMEDAKDAVEHATDKAKDAVAALANPEPGVDPVCKMKLGDESLVITVDGKDFGFCSQHCADAFKEDPAKYLTAKATEEH